MAPHTWGYGRGSVSVQARFQAIGERRRSCGPLEQHRADPPDIGGGTHGAPEHLLRGHVARCPHAASSASGSPGDAQVRSPWRAPGSEITFDGFQVQVDDPLAMQVLDRRAQVHTSQWNASSVETKVGASAAPARCATVSPSIVSRTEIIGSGRGSDQLIGLHLCAGHPVPAPAWGPSSRPQAIERDLGPRAGQGHRPEHRQGCPGREVGESGRRATWPRSRRSGASSARRRTYGDRRGVFEAATGRPPFPGGIEADVNGTGAHPYPNREESSQAAHTDGPGHRRLPGPGSGRKAPGRQVSKALDRLAMRALEQASGEANAAHGSGVNGDN